MPSGTRNVDERIVEMRIDNQQFERGAKTTISTLEKLEKALNLKTPKNSAISDLADQVNKFDASPMTTAIEKVGNSFSAMEVIGKRVIENLTDSVYNFATKTVKDLTIGQVGAGFDKYEQMIEATQTIMAATRDLIGDESSGLGWKDQSDQMKYVNAQLEKMLWYTDETSYSFTDMASNVGKFLSAGVKVDDAFQSMMGIASWGASAGAKPAEVSRAMYNISQAMGQGYMQLMDWKSIENANMGTLEFKQNVLDVAAELNKFVKVQYGDDESMIGYMAADASELQSELQLAEDGLYHLTFGGKQSVEEFDATVKDSLITATNFRESLKDKWFDTEVMTEVFKRYGEFSNQLYLATQNTDLEASGILDALSKYREFLNGTIDAKAFNLAGWADEAKVTEEQFQKILEDLNAIGWQFESGELGFRMGQEAKTWTDALEATKDAVSSGWMQTFKLIFGDYLQAKQFWTDVTGELWEIFASGGNKRNKVLKEWATTFDELGNTGRDYLLGKKNVEYIDEFGEKQVEEFQGAFWDIIDAIHSVTDPIKEAFSEVFGVDGVTLIDLTRRLKEFTSGLGLSEEAGKGLKAIFKTLFTILKAGLKVLGTAISFILRVAYALNVLVDALLSNGNVASALEVVRGALSGIIPSLMEVGDLLLTIMGPALIGIFEKIDPFTNKLQQLFFVLRTGFGRNGIAGALESFEIWFKHLEKPAWLSKITSGLQFLLIPFGLIMAGVERLVSVFPVINNKFQEIKDTFKDANIFAVIWEKVAIWFQNLKPNIASVAESFSILRDVLKDAFAKGVDPSGIIELLKQAWTSLKGFVSSITFADIFKAISMALKVSLVSYLIGIIKNINWVAKNSKGVLESVSGMFGSIEDTFVAMQDSIKANILIKLAVAIGLLAGALFLLSKVPTDKLVVATVALGGILFLMQKLMKGGGLSLFSEENVNKNFKGILNGATINLLPKLAANLLGLAAVIGVLAHAIVSFKKNDVGWMDIVKVFAAVTLIFGAAIGAMAVMKELKLDDFGKSLGLLVTMATVIYYVGKYVKSVKDVPWQNLLIALIGMGGIMAAIGFVVREGARYKKFKGDTILHVAGLIIAVALAIKMITVPVKQIGKLEIGQAIQGIIGVGVLLVALGGMMTWMSKLKVENGNGLIGIAAGIVAFAFAIRLLAKPLAMIGKLEWPNILGGFVGIGLLMVALGGLASWMSQINPGKMIVTAGAMVVMAVAIDILVPAFMMIAGVVGGVIAAIPWDKLIEHVGGFGKALAYMVGFAGAMILFGIAMKLIGTGVLRFGAGALSVTGSVLVFSLAILAVAAAIHLLSDSLPQFVQALLDTFTIIKDNMTTFIEMFGLIIAGIAAAILARKLDISLAVVELIVTILTVIALKGPEILEVLRTLFTNILTFVSGLLDILVSFLVVSVISVLEALAEGLRANKAALLHAVFNVIEVILEVVAEAFLWLSRSIGKILIDIVLEPFQSIAKSITDKINSLGVVPKWMHDMFGIDDMKAPQWLTDFANFDASEFLDAGYTDATRITSEKLQEWLIPPEAETVVLNSAESLGGKVGEGFENSKSGIMEKLTGLTTDMTANLQTPETLDGFQIAGATDIKAYLSGMAGDDGGFKQIMDQFTALGKNGASTLDATVPQYYTSGENMITGLNNGITDMFNSGVLQKNVENIGQQLIGAFNGRRSLDEHSPSRKTWLSGKNFILGFTGGVSDAASEGITEVVGFGDQMVKAIMSTMAQAAYIASDEFDFSPRITPVVDMGNVSSAASYVNGAFGGSYSMSASMSNAVSRRLGEVGQIAANMSGGGNQTVNGDQITFNIYQQPGESTDALADAVISRINSKMIRRRAAFG